MRDTVSRHTEPCRARPAHYGWRQPYGRFQEDDFRPVFNVYNLSRLLKDVVDMSLDQKPGQGKKRAAPTSPPRASKRRKNVDGNVAAAVNTMSYPSIYPRQKNVPPNTTPILNHTFSIRYHTRTEGDDPRRWSDDATWKQEEDELIALLEDVAEESIDLGTLVFAQSESLFVAISQSHCNEPKAYLILLPQATEERDPSSVLRYAHTLERDGLASITASLRLERHSEEDMKDDVDLPFTVLVNVTISILPSLFEPIGADDKLAVYNMQRVRELFHARESLLRHVYVPVPRAASVTIPHMYSILQSAPPLPAKVADAVQPDGLVPTLLPFQRRSVAWLLGREGKEVTTSGQVIPRAKASEYTFWRKFQEGDLAFYFNVLSGEACKEIESEPLVHGAILAEEPGLGKTVEVISLILLNPAPPERNPVNMSTFDDDAGVLVKGVKGTLIVTPPALAAQWTDELARHAPTLKVMLYQGWSKVSVPINATQVAEEREKRLKANKKKRGKKGPDLDLDDIVDWCTYVNDYDVVVTTYTELRNDLNVARPTVKRPRRGTVVYSNVERPRSPLIMCEWHRVVMDEVQMVGGGKVEEMMALIPRVSSFAVSGTPARAQVADLIHVLKFLRIDGIVGSQKQWQSLISDENAELFNEFMCHFTIRTMKATLESELTIPQQTRFLVPVEMGRVERHVYDQALEGVLLDLGLDARGVAASAGWEVDAGVLRSSIRRLRGICTHPQVGQLQNERLGGKASALKTMEEVLQTMQDQNWRIVLDDFKLKVQTMVRKAQLRQLDKSKRRHHDALEILLAAEIECNAMIGMVEAEIAEHTAKGEALKLEKSKSKSAEPLNGKGKEREQSVESDDESEDGLPRSAAADEHKHKRQALSNRLRESRIVLHRIKFMQGDVYNVLGGTFEQQESDAYAFCEALRRDLLKGTADEANKGMEQLDADATKQGIDEYTLKIGLPYLQKGGIRSSHLVDQLHDMIEYVLNQQSRLLWDWRSRLHGLLTNKLISDNGDADGQEYQRSLDDQGEAETYLQAYATLLSDRRQALVNERTLLAVHDAREKRIRKTKAAMAAAHSDPLNNPDELELQPEHEVLLKQLNDMRRELLQELNGRSVKSILVDMTSAMNKILRETDPEKALLKEFTAKMRSMMAAQGRALDKLDADLALFRKAFNQRILYFRQLQEISDTVAQVTWENMSYEEAVLACDGDLEDLETSLKTNKARQRYMDNLQKDRDETHNEGDDDCVLCGCEFERGFLTGCAHVFCEGCLKAWVEVKKGKVCPVCRVPIEYTNLHRFTVGEKQPQKKPSNTEAVPQSRRQIDYNKIPETTMEAIQTYMSYGDYGQKIQTLVRHLLYLQDTEPGCKSIVFSAWADSLHILDRALTENGIGCLRIDQGAKGAPAATRFKNDGAIQVLLLHGERENAGLNITCASRVFLLESVVQHGFEVQAIARIDRLGQTRPTEVYCYYAEGTVEKNILDLAARRGLSLYTKDNSTGTLHVSSLDDKGEDKAVDLSPKKKKDQKALKGDFISKIDDMLAVLFPHMYEEVEYLLPDDDDTLGGAPLQQQNAIAGPSHLRD